MFLFRVIFRLRQNKKFETGRREGFDYSRESMYKGL